MGTKKDIGKVFQEKFKDFEQAPDAGTWDAIAAGLDGKSNNRFFVPLWITVGTIFILSVIGLLFWQPWTPQSEDSSPQVVHTSSKDKEEDFPSVQKNDSSDYRLEANTKTTQGAETAVQQSETESVASNNTATDHSKTRSEALGTSASAVKVPGSKISKTKNATIANVKNTKDITDAKNTRSKAKNSSTALSAVLPKKGTLNQNKIYLDSKASKTIQRDPNAPGIIKMDAASKERLIAKEREARIAYNLQMSEEKEALKTIRLAQVAAERKRRDSLSTVKKNAVLEAAEKKAAEIEKEKDDSPKTAVEKSLDRKEAVTYNFAVSPYASILSYGSLVKGSSIDDRLVDNPREAINTQGYGIRLEYNLSERASFRFGVGVSPLKYQTNNFQVLNNGGTINVYQFSGLTPTQLEQGGTPTNPDAVAFFNNYDVITIEQNISYLEVPMDYQYKLINKRVGLSINPGISVFILTDNNVFAIANDNTRLRIGRETSLNDLSFAFNLGLGGHYNFAKHWRLDVEPTFRYQLNPYSNSLGNFKPYYLGVQFGATYKF